VAKQNKQQEVETEINEVDAGIESLREDDSDKEVVELRDQLEQAQLLAQQNKEQYLRTLADMDNLRKRTQREKEDLSKFANENILREILPVIDNLERAIDHAEQTKSHEGLLEGVEMTLSQFNQLLEKFGVKPVDALGQLFDPAYHQAMGQLESEEYPVNTVVQQMQKGYELNQRLLRPSFVMLAKAPVVVETTVDELIENREEIDEE